MTRDASQIPNNPRKQIGPAVWLFLLLLRFIPSEWTGDEPAWVAGGVVVSDKELAERLEVSLAMIARWRCRLRAAGVIGWLVSPGKGRAFWVAGANRIFGAHGEMKTAEQKPAAETAVAKTETALTAAGASRWVQ